ncbi:MAG TPA: hypothetical protein VLI42_07485 [Chthoniobacterales bacterium]|nr:hypothetical protein [Chthoniobacterales bacterium]
MDWATSFQALTGKATSSYEGVLERWQELLKKVSRGELAPSSLEDRLPEFLHEEGGEFYRRLAALSFELCNALAEVQAKSTNDFMRALLGDAVVAEQSSPLSPPAPPLATSEPDEWTRWYQNVTVCIVEQNESALSCCQVLLEKVADGRLTPKSVQEFSRKFMNERALALSGDAGAAQMRFYESLLQLNREFVENLFARLVREGDARSAQPNEPLRIELTGTTEMTVPAGSPVFLAARATSAPRAAAGGKKVRSAGSKRTKKSPAKRSKKEAAQ